MTKPLIVRAGVLLAFAALVTAGCGGGDDDLTVEEYFDRLQAIGDGIAAESEPLFAALGPLEADPGDAAALTALSGRLDRFADVIRDAAADVKDLAPPSDVAEAHDEYVASFDRFREQFEDLAAAAHEAETAAAIEPLFAAAFTNAQFDDACKALVRIAADHGIRLDLGCDDDDPEGG